MAKKPRGVFQKPDGRYYISYRDEFGKQHTQTFGRGTEAKKLAQSRYHELTAERVKGVKPQAPSFVRFDDLVFQYIEERKIAGVSKSFLSELRYILNRHVYPFLPVKPLDRLTFQDLTRQSRNQKGNSERPSNVLYPLQSPHIEKGLDIHDVVDGPLRRQDFGSSLLF